MFSECCTLICVLHYFQFTAKWPSKYRAKTTAAGTRVSTIEISHSVVQSRDSFIFNQSTMVHYSLYTQNTNTRSYLQELSTVTVCLDWMHQAIGVYGRQPEREREREREREEVGSRWAGSVWLSLLPAVRDNGLSLNTFRQKMKTYLFVHPRTSPGDAVMAFL